MLTIEDLKRKTKEKGFTYEELYERSGVPVGTIKQIFCGRTPSPKYDTVCAIMRALDLDNETQAPIPDYVRVYEALSERGKVLALGYMEGLLESEGKDIKQIILVEKKSAKI
jgi:transcriptional regulator with XRE-family HTH domain